MKFRPGAQCVRISLGIIVTSLGAGGCAPAPDRATHTVDEYTQSASLRHEVLARCNSDPGSLKDSADCANAREAERRTGVGNLRDLPPLKLPENHQ